MTRELLGPLAWYALLAKLAAAVWCLWIMRRSPAMLAFLGLVVIPYCLWSLLIDVRYAMGWRAWMVAAVYTVLAFHAAYNALPGKQERGKVLALWIAPWVLWAGVAFWLTDAGRFEVAWLAEYRLVSGACICGAATTGLAGLYAIWRGKEN